MRNHKILNNGWEIISERNFMELYDRHGEAAFGTFNQAPAIFKPISQEELARQHDLNGMCIVGTAYRQLHRAHDGTPFEKMIACTIHLNNLARGWAIEFDYWKKEIRFYEVGLCDHEGMYQNVIATARCYREFQCPKCGMKHAHDSSD